MGGGSMMYAMKVAARLGGANGGFRGSPFSAASGQSAMKPSRPASAAMSSSSAADVAAPLHTAAAFDASGLVMEAGEPMPRVVFNGAIDRYVPSIQEAKDATIELKEAIDQICLSSSSSNKHEVSSDGSRVSAQSPHSELETKSCESELVPKHALQAFQYLKDSSKAQNVVASIVSDRNVWNAIMQNSELKNFLHSQGKVAGFEPNNRLSFYKKHHATWYNWGLREMPDSDETSSQTNGFFHSFNGFMQKVKRSVAEMLSDASSYLHSLLGYLSPEKMGSDDAENPNNIFSDPATLVGTFFGLAVVVAMVVLFKRV